MLRGEHLLLEHRTQEHTKSSDMCDWLPDPSPLVSPHCGNRGRPERPRSGEHAVAKPRLFSPAPVSLLNGRLEMDAVTLTASGLPLWLTSTPFARLIFQL